ncbi:MAG: bifunctional UDP-N-acetylglucosamine diphosphorylase/glucosamine-1-phosphate N-acetyltransferase GlmU [Endomicrobium sp.]|jgi:bifunctional UDP-N-acetylglucosamine pyrophosphorylase/glucosamine-1-phosphate N-acetyltransferase|nr:bifunctional UDP-N-acetylglucosamine diphosphorylase/glucosamine-1-phosphate N-acetyltransferase GlmU [Endomicrobium sp.]
MKNFSAVILAAGSGTRMRSSLPKVMHRLAGKPLIKWVIEAVSAVKPDDIIVVLGHGSEVVEKYLYDSGVKFVYQREQLGTAHAVMEAGKKLENYGGDILVLNGDAPFVKPSTLSALVKKNSQTNSSVTVLSAEFENSFGYGRIIRKNGFLEKIVEERDASSTERSIKEVNSGVYCFDRNLWRILPKIKSNNAKKEYYITDAVGTLRKFGKKISLHTVKDGYEIRGINDRSELAEAEVMLKNKKIEGLLCNGVSILDIGNVYISYDAKIGRDTIVYPGVFIDAGVSIGKNCIIKGTSYIANSKIGEGSVVSYSYIDGAVVNKKVRIGPFSHIRHGSVLKDGVKIGNFSETKKAVIAKNSKINHLSYIGDARVGESVNVGAGTITCNYDGVKKHQTFIGSKSFIGSNVNFVAPVKIGCGVLVAAGSTVTRDVPSGNLVIARARQELKRIKK